MSLTDSVRHGDREDERTLTLPYECLRSIHGGMSEVRLWHDPVLECDRVGKRIDISGIEHDGALPEPATLEAISHKNVVPVLAAPHVEGFLPPMRVVELITPFYPRGSITDALLRGERFKPSEAVSIAQAALRGLGHLHDVHLIAHRDVKSGNILLSGDSSVAKIADLGLAGRFDQDGNVPTLNNPTLYSPAEVGGQALARASDLYPFALVLRELLGGHLPYTEYTMTSIVERLTRGLPAVRSRDMILPIWTPRSLRRIIRKASDRNPSNRYQTAREFDAQLARAVVVDWQEASTERWEAPFIHSAKRKIAIEARPMIRSGKVRLSTLANHGNGWRRRFPDVDVPDLSGPQARNVFDQASDIASVR